MQEAPAAIWQIGAQSSAPLLGNPENLLEQHLENFSDMVFYHSSFFVGTRRFQCLHLTDKKHRDFL
jgi:hypothetical protein